MPGIFFSRENFLKNIFFIFPSDLEYNPIIKKLKPEVHPDFNFIRVSSNESKNFYFVKSGIGKKKSISIVKKIHEEFEPDLIISSGCCGGLKPYIKPYNIFSPSEAQSENNKSYNLISLRSNLYKHSIFEGKSFSVKKPASRDRKIQIADFHPEALFVDMETYWIAKTSIDLGVKAASLRVSVDVLKNNIPIFGNKSNSINKIKNDFLKFIYKYRASKAMNKLCEIIKELFLQY